MSSKNAGQEQDVELRRSDNPYKSKLNEPLDEEESLERKLKYVLNRLTPQNFQKLIIDLLNLPIDTQEKLEKAVDIIYKTSLNEQIYSPIFARACKLLSEIKVPFKHVSSEFISFLIILLKKCEQEFDTDFHKDKYYEYLIYEAESCADDNERKALLKKADEQLEKAKSNYIGNVKFLAELYNMGLLDEIIIYECIDKLISNQNDQENLECLCKLLSTIGKEFDKPHNKEKIDSCLDKLRNISDRKDLISPRIRFMILDLLELREKNWVPRHENIPRRVDDIRKEFEKEQERKTTELNLMPDESLSGVQYGICHGLRYSLFYGFGHHILDEYSKTKNLDHALNDFEQIKLTQHSDLIEAMITIVLDKNEHERESLGELFYISLKLNKLDLNQFTEGLKKCLITSVAMTGEGQNMLKSLSQVLSHLFSPDFINLKFLYKAFEPVLNEKLSAVLIAEVVKHASRRIGKQTVKDLFEISDMKIHDFLQCFESFEIKNDFLKNNGIDWMIDRNEHLTEQCQYFETYKRKLFEILDNVFLDNQTVIDKIESQFDKNEIESREFIHAMVISVLRSSMVHKKLDQLRLKKRIPLLKKFVSDREEFQLEVLYSVQAMDFHIRYQPDFITTVFGLFHDDDLVHEDMFWKWKRNARGKGHAISEFILKKFFQWLSKSQPEE